MEPGLPLVLAYAALPAFGNFLGGMLAERLDISDRRLSLALHGAGGVVIGIVALEIMPEALGEANPWLVLGSFLAGGLAFIALEHATHHIRARFAGKEGSATAWSIFLGVSIDLFSDGVMIGAGSSVSPGLGLLLAMGQVPADVPEGFATIATFKRQGMPRGRRLLLLAAFALPILLGALLGFFAVRGQPEPVKLALLAVTAGALTTLVVEEIVPAAHEKPEPSLAALVFLAGFGLFGAISFLFG